MTELEKKLSEQNEQLTRIISNLTQTIDDLKRMIADQSETIEKLQEQLNNRFPVCRTIEVRQSDYHSFAGVLEDA